MSSKVFYYILAFQLAISQPWSSTTVAIIGILTGALYRSDIASLKSYRLSPLLVRLSSRFLLPLVGSMRAPRRTTRALPEERSTSRLPTNEAEPEVITTARPPPTTPEATTTGVAGASGTSVMREWVNELTGRTERASTGLRVPNDAEIAQLTSMFPDVQREVIVGALQRSSNTEGAVETLLSSQ